MIEIDGSYLEGGGQILRTSIALSCLTGKPIHITKIRANRQPSGLKAQHLAAIEAIKNLCNGKLKGAFIGSKEIWFYPKEIKKDFLKIKISTAGSASLVLQTIFLSSLNIEKGLNVEIDGGGTFGKWAPSILYLQNVFLPTIEKFGFRAEIKVIKHGFYPKGGARIIAKIFPSKLKGYEIKRKIEGIKGISLASENLKKAKVSERQILGAENVLREFELDITSRYISTLSTGSAIEIFSKPTRIGASCLGEVGLRAEEVGKRAAKELIENLNSGATVDKHLADQLIPFMALVEGGSSYLVKDLTNHTKTNIWVVEKFIDRKFKIEKAGNLFRVSI